VLEDQGDSPRRAQILVRDDPDWQLEGDLRENSTQARRTGGERHLTEADSNPRANGREIGGVVVGPQREVSALSEATQPPPAFSI
jgi:hypothetical protein